MSSRGQPTRNHRAPLRPPLQARLLLDSQLPWPRALECQNPRNCLRMQMLKLGKIVKELRFEEGAEGNVPWRRVRSRSPAYEASRENFGHQHAFRPSPNAGSDRL